MKAFLINLDKNTERLAASRAQLDKLGVEFERVRAVYGKELSAEEKRRAVNRFRWWCAKGYKVRDGEIGCAMSHAVIYRRMIEEHLPMACVLEDDNRYTSRFTEVVDAVSKMIDLDLPQVVLLTNRRENRHENPSVPKLVPTDHDQHTAGYILTQKAAKAILRANTPIQVPADNWRRWQRRGIIRLYHALPMVCIQDNEPLFESDIEGRGENVLRVKDLPTHKWLLFKLKRLIGTIIDRSLPL